MITILTELARGVMCLGAGLSIVTLIHVVL